MRINLKNSLTSIIFIILIMGFIFSIFIPLISADTQTRTCRDLNRCNTDNPWIEENECIPQPPGTHIIFTPNNRNLVVANNTRINFVGDILQKPGDSIKVDWYLNNEFQKGDSLSGSLVSSFNRIFSQDSIVKAELTINSQTQTEIWEITINSDAGLDCEEKWSCEYSECDGSYKYRIDDTCQEDNQCGTNLDFPPTQISCNCIPQYECGEWSECNVDYNINDLLQGKETTNGEQTRTCNMVNGCSNEKKVKIENQQCDFSVPVRFEESEWCFQEYVEVYEIESNNLVSRIKQKSVGNIFALDVGFTTTEFEGICTYCFDGVKNFDETGVDCGGNSCPTCRDKGDYFDYLYYVIVGLWTLFFLLAAYYVISKRKEIAIFFGAIINAIKKFRFRKPKFKKPTLRLRLPKISLSIGRRRVRRRVFVERPIKQVPVPELPKEPRERDPYGDMKKMLKKWKKVPMYATTLQERKLITGIRDWRERRKHSKEMRALEKERKKILRQRERAILLNKKQREKEERRREREFASYQEERAESVKKKTKRRFFSVVFSNYKKRREKRKVKKSIRREIKRRKKHARKERRIHRKTIKKHIRVIKKRIRKKQVPHNEIPNLRNQIKEWKKQGFNNTYRLEKKLDKLEKKKPWRK